MSPQSHVVALQGVTWTPYIRALEIKNNLHDVIRFFVKERKRGGGVLRGEMV
jgi:hypothetical protein